jgi:cytochrome c biogenesis factor
VTVNIENVKPNDVEGDTMGKIKINIWKLLFVIITSIIFTGTAIFVFVFLLPRFLGNVDPKFANINVAFFISCFLILIELIFAIVGLYVFIASNRKNMFLLIALLIACLEYIVSGVKLALICLEIGFTIHFSQFGIGVNFIGVALLVWYLRLSQQQNNISSISDLAQESTEGFK